MAQIAFSYDNAGNRILRKTSGPLPVTLISFTAVRWPATKLSGEAEGSTALLNWQTSSEINSDRFDIERSQDGKKWMSIGIVTASGDKKSSSSYSFSDKSPMAGRSVATENLYRLKMIDRDGSFSFSRIQGLNFESLITFYPNPVKDLLKITGFPAAGTVKLFNASGKPVLSLGNIPANGIDMSGLPAGVYMVNISLKDGSSVTSKVVKE